MLTKLTNCILFFLLSLFFLEENRRGRGGDEGRDIKGGEKRECQIYKTLTFKFVKVQKNKTSSHKWKQKLRDQGRWKSRIQTGVRLHWHQALFFLRVLVLLLKLKIITKLNENSECTHLVYIDFMLQKPPVHMTETFLVQYSLSHSRFLLGKNQTENSVIWLMLWIMFLKPLWFYWMTCGGEELMRAFPLL